MFEFLPQTVLQFEFSLMMVVSFVSFYPKDDCFIKLESAWDFYPFFAGFCYNIFSMYFSIFFSKKMWALLISFLMMFFLINSLNHLRFVIYFSIF